MNCPMKNIRHNCPGFLAYRILPSLCVGQNIRQLSNSSGPSRFRLLMSDGQHSSPCEYFAVADKMSAFCLASNAIIYKEQK